VAHGSHTGAGGGQAATVGLGKHQLQQPQPALLMTKNPKADRIDILIIALVSLQETNPSSLIRRALRPSSVLPLLARTRKFGATQPYPAANDVQTQPLQKCDVLQRQAPRRSDCADGDDRLGRRYSAGR